MRYAADFTRRPRRERNGPQERVEPSLREPGFAGPVEMDAAHAEGGLSLAQIYDRHAELHDLLWEATEDLRRAAEARRRAIAAAPASGPLKAAIAAAATATASADHVRSSAEAQWSGARSTPSRAPDPAAEPIPTT